MLKITYLIAKNILKNSRNWGFLAKFWVRLSLVVVEVETKKHPTFESSQQNLELCFEAKCCRLGDFQILIDIYGSFMILLLHLNKKTSNIRIRIWTFSCHLRLSFNWQSQNIYKIKKLKFKFLITYNFLFNSNNVVDFGETVPMAMVFYFSLYPKHNRR